MADAARQMADRADGLSAFLKLAGRTGQEVAAANIADQLRSLAVGLDGECPCTR